MNQILFEKANKNDLVAVLCMYVKTLTFKFKAKSGLNCPKIVNKAYKPNAHLLDILMHCKSNILLFNFIILTT